MTKEMVIAIVEKNDNGYWETKEGKVVVEICYGDNEEIVNALEDNAKIVGGGFTNQKMVRKQKSIGWKIKPKGLIFFKKPIDK